MYRICLLANEFPYGTWEPYLETEYSYHNADEMIICSLQLRDAHKKTKRALDGNPLVIPVRYVSRLKYFFEAVFTLSDVNLYREIINQMKKNELTVKRIVSLFVFMSRAHHEYRCILRSMPKELPSELLFYSYRFEYQPYVAMLLKKRIGNSGKIICRAHRYDLYEDQHQEDYIPCREIILHNIDYVFPCSLDGVDYLVNRFPRFKDKIEVSYLGTRDYGIGPVPDRNNKYRVVSCSNVVKVKRINLIVDALSQIKDINIEWVHFGDGPLLEDITKYAGERLPENIKSIFYGNVANSDLMRFYQTEKVDMFVNTSSSEGIPVSIMEALSFGIPCIATDVGGTKEIIENKEFGVLLDSDFDVSELRGQIIGICNMSSDSYMNMRKQARFGWGKKFNAEKNYKGFIKRIQELY